MFGSPASPPQGDLTDMFGIKSPFWPPPWSLFFLAAIVGLGLAWKHCINFYVLSLFTSSSLHHNNQENLKKYKKNNNKNVSINMSDGYEPVSSLLSTKKSRQSFGIGGITALVAAFLVYAVLSNLSFKAQRFNAAVVEVGNIPPASLPLNLPPPPEGIVGEVAIEEVSSEYEDISSSFSPHTPKARVSFLKDKAASLLRGATVQTFLLSPDSKEGEEDLDDRIVRVGTPKVASSSDDLLSLSKSGFHHVGLKGYDQMPFKFSGRVRTLFQSLGQSDGGPSSSAFFSMAYLKTKAVGFLSGATPVQDIFEKSVEDATTISMSASDEFATQTEDRVIGFVGNMDVGELKPDTSINYDSYSCPTDMHLRYKNPVDKDGVGWRLGGLTKWIKCVLLASSNDDTRDGSCMKVNEAFGDWPYSPDKSIISYQDGAVYCLLKKASNPTILGGLDVDSAFVGQAGATSMSNSKKASLLDVFSDKCDRSDKVSFPKNKAGSFIKDLDDGNVRVGKTPEVAARIRDGLKGYDQLSFDSDTSSVCVTVPSPNDISKEVRVDVSSDDLGHTIKVSSSLVDLDESMKVQLHNPSLPWYLVLTMMITLILCVILVKWRSSPASISLAIFHSMPKSMFALQGVRDDKLVSRQYSRYSLRKHKKAKQMSFTRLVQLVMLSIILSNVLMSNILSSACALEIGENVSEDNLGEMSSDVLDDEYEKVKTEDQQGLNMIDAVAPDVHDPPEFEDQFLSDGLYDDLEDDEYEMMIALMKEYEQEELGDRASDKAQLWPTKSVTKSSDMALIEKGQSSSEMKELEEFRRQQLRGSIEGDVNHLAIIPRIVDFLQHRVDEAKALKNIILNGSVAEVAAALSMYFDNTQAVAKIASSADENEEHALDFPAVTNEEGQLHGRKLQAFLSEVAPDELVDLLHLNEDGIDEMEHYVDVMENVERKLIPESSRRRRSTQKMLSGAPHPSMNDKVEEKPKFKLPRLKVVEELKAKLNKHGRHLQEDLPAPQCREKCQSNDFQCNCQRLVDYARKLTWYDASVMFLGGYVQGDPDVDDYGDLNVEFMSDIDMFDVRNQLPEKMQSIEDKADEAERDMSIPTCTALLSELHTACGGDVCTEPNMDSFQLSVDQVGSSVNTHTKLKVAAIGEFYDFQRLTVRRDNVGNNRATKTPLNERRPVRCCRDDEPTDEEDIWYKSPIAISKSLAGSCPYAWEQKWTGDVALPSLRAVSANIGANIGTAFTPTTTHYSPISNTWTLDGPSNGNIFGAFDIFRYTYAQTTGEIDMRLRIDKYTGTTSGHCAGLMIRQSLNPTTRHFSILYCGDKRIRRLRRNVAGRSTEGVPGNNPRETDVIEGPVWLRITFGYVRNDNNFRVWTSSDGTSWRDLGWGGGFPNSGFTRSSTFYVGIANNRGTLEASGFAINGAPALPNYLPTRTTGSGTVGSVDGAPDTTYSPIFNMYTVVGPSNGLISGTSDIFQYTYVQTTGNIDMRLRVTDFTGTTSDHCAGLMIRQSLAAGSRHFSILYCGDKRVRRLRRNDVGGSTEGVPGNNPRETDEIEGPVWLRITFGPTSSSANTFRVLTSSHVNPSDEDWDDLGWGGFGLFTTTSTFYVGIAVSQGTLEASDFTISDMQVLPNNLVLPITPPVVQGYTSYNQRMCNNDNQFLDVDGFEENEDGLISISSAQECASYCNESLDCVSFDFFGNSCRVSSSCEHFSLTDPNPISQWYFKNVDPPSYKKYGESLCTTGSSDLASTNANSVQECANICSENHECVSFAYPTTNGSTECRLSSTCHDVVNMPVNNSWNTYVKRDQDDDEDEDVCPFLPFAQAEEYCEEAGGRLCTRNELEGGCASFMGCNFDTANVWSSTETDPMTCPATYQETCGDFVTAFESLYDARNETIFPDDNPMRIDRSRPADSTDFTNVQFPFAYNWETPNEHGIVSINPDNAFEYSVLSNNPADLFCGVSQGPPSVLAKACDDSMELLLGPGVSVGLLTSTANDVNEFDPDEPFREPIWLTWYLNQNNTKSIAPFDKWTEAYLKIEDPDGDPIWMEDYLNIQDQSTPFIISQVQTFSNTEIRSINEIYCVDKSIADDDQTLQYCQRAWLDDKTNRYEDMTWYTSIPYPTSDVTPFNNTCNAASTCQESWLENDLNPFSEDTNAGCHAFWGYCRGYDPSRYQCKVFWDYCRTEQDSRNPGWKYPKENCTDTSISLTEDIVTCPINWLDNLDNPYTDEREQNESCYNFWNYCRNELDDINPDWEYPRPTCNDDNGIEIETCQKTWLDDDDENPYDSTTDSECHDFWEYCHDQLIYKYPRHVWPLPADPTVDDLLPGYCCLDTPLTTDTTTKFWGSHYNAARSEAGMKCNNRGFWHMGMSFEACHHGGGQFFRNPCITLKRCIDARPREGEDGYKETFEEWVIAEEIDIYDPNDQEQCERAREALDYEPDYYNDYEVCETFDALLCDDFFEDLQFLSDAAAESPPVEFEQVTFTSIEYPKDKPLFFQELPSEVPIKNANVDTEDGDGSTALEITKQVLGIATGSAKDAIDKFVATQEAKDNKMKAFCKDLEFAYDKLWRAYFTCSNKCNVADKTFGLTLGAVLFGKGKTKGKTKSNPTFNACTKKCKPLSIKASNAGNPLAACRQKYGVTIMISDTFKFAKWLFYWGIKVAHEAVDNAVFDWSIKETGSVEVRDYTKAIYDNTKGQFEWIHDALGVMTNNTIKQHSQMREELQNRHQDITNDVNRYTTCMSNFLGIQIFNALPGTRTGPLSSTCQNILGVSGRRLNEEGGADDDLSIEGFNLQVEFLPKSFVVKQDTIIENEEEIMKKEDEIIKKEDEIQKTLDSMMNTVNGIARKLDMDPAVLEPKKKRPKAPKKPKHAKPSNDQEEGGSQEEEDLFKRNLLAVEEVKSNFDGMKSQGELLQSNFESMKSQVKMMESKVQSIEDKVGSMESKVDKMEKTMEEIKEMLSLMMRGGVDA